MIIALTDSVSSWHSFWIRIGEYLRCVQGNAIITNDIEGLQSLCRGDTLIIYRYDLRWGQMHALLQNIQSRGVRIISDVDDYLWGANGWSEARIKGLEEILALVDIITCSTDYMRRFLMTKYPSTEVIVLPNTSPRKWLDFGKKRVSDSLIRIGWTGASWTRASDLFLLRPVIEWVKQNSESARLVHIGHNSSYPSFAEIMNIDPSLVETVQMCSYKNYLKSFHFDIGLAPLSDKKFNEFKSPIKVIEYSSYGIPWIASCHSVYQVLCDEWNWKGRLCRTDNDWVDAIQQLQVDSLRSKEGYDLMALSASRLPFVSGIRAWRAILEP